MITLKRFAFNPFQVNTYILSDETGECIIIDAGMQGEDEEGVITEYIDKHKLKPVMLVLTHAHIDHILGNSFVANKYNIELFAHAESAPFLENAISYASTFGLTLDKVKEIDNFIIHPEHQGHSFGKQFLDFLEDWAKKEIKKFGYSENDLYTKGFKIYTTLDSRMQQYAEEAMEEHMTNLQRVFNKQQKSHQLERRWLFKIFKDSINCPFHIFFECKRL